MSRLPCDACGQAFFGRSSTVYPARSSPTGRVSYAGRLDPGCLSTYLAVCREKLDERLAGVPSPMRGLNTCRWCGVVTEGDIQQAWWVSAFFNGSERRDYGGPVCDECDTTAAQNLVLGFTERPPRPV